LWHYNNELLSELIFLAGPAIVTVTDCDNPMPLYTTGYNAIRSAPIGKFSAATIKAANVGDVPFSKKRKVNG
jgi:hypothetical protein